MHNMQKEMAILRQTDKHQATSDKEEHHSPPVVPRILEVPGRPLDETVDNDGTFPVATDHPWWASKDQPARQSTPRVKEEASLDPPLG